MTATSRKRLARDLVSALRRMEVAYLDGQDMIYPPVATFGSGAGVFIDGRPAARDLSAHENLSRARITREIEAAHGAANAACAALFPGVGLSWSFEIEMTDAEYIRGRHLLALGQQTAHARGRLRPQGDILINTPLSRWGAHLARLSAYLPDPGPAPSVWHILADGLDSTARTTLTADTVCARSAADALVTASFKSDLARSLATPHPADQVRAMIRQDTAFDIAALNKALDVIARQTIEDMTSSHRREIAAASLAPALRWQAAATSLKAERSLTLRYDLATGEVVENAVDHPFAPAADRAGAPQRRAEARAAFTAYCEALRPWLDGVVRHGLPAIIHTTLNDTTGIFPHASCALNADLAGCLAPAFDPFYPNAPCAVAGTLSRIAAHHVPQTFVLSGSSITGMDPARVGRQDATLRVARASGPLHALFQFRHAGAATAHRGWHLARASAIGACARHDAMMQAGQAAASFGAP